MEIGLEKGLKACYKFQLHNELGRDILRLLFCNTYLPAYLLTIITLVINYSIYNIHTYIFTNTYIRTRGRVLLLLALTLNINLDTTTTLLYLMNYLLLI